MIENAAADPATPTPQPGAGMSRQDLQLVGPDGGQRGKAQAMQIADIVKSARIAEVMWHFQLGSELDPVAVGELRKARLALAIFVLVALGLFGKQRGANAYRLGEFDVAILNHFGFQIKRSRGSVPARNAPSLVT